VNAVLHGNKVAFSFVFAELSNFKLI